MKDTVILSGSEESRRGPSARPQDDLRVGFSPASVLTRTELLDHAKHPRNRGELPDADIVQEESNPLCGDVVTIYATFRHPEHSEGSRPLKDQGPSSPEPALERNEEAPQADTVIDRVGFTGSGCIISQAAGSLLTEHVQGTSMADVQRMERTDIEALIGGILSPSRVKCAMLPLVALQNGIRKHSGA